MNDYVLKEIKEAFRDFPRDDDVPGIVADVCRAEAYDPGVWGQDESCPLTIKAKKDWLRVLLTGAVIVPAGGDAGFLAVESVSDVSMMQWLPLFGTCYARTRGIFYGVREAMRDWCPELLTEITREEYERVWPGWTDGLDMVHVVMRASGSFWEPLVTEALERWGGFRARRPKDGTAAWESAARLSLQWLMSFGKPGGAGVPLEVLMAMAGNTLPSLPDLVEAEAGQLRDSEQSRMEAGNGVYRRTPSVSESGSVWYDMTGEMTGYTKFSRFDRVPEIDFVSLRSRRAMRKGGDDAGKV